MTAYWGWSLLVGDWTFGGRVDGCEGGHTWFGAFWLLIFGGICDECRGRNIGVVTC